MMRCCIRGDNLVLILKFSECLKELRFHIFVNMISERAGGTMASTGGKNFSCTVWLSLLR